MTNDKKLSHVELRSIINKKSMALLEFIDPEDFESVVQLNAHIDRELIGTNSALNSYQDSIEDYVDIDRIRRYQKETCVDTKFMISMNNLADLDALLLIDLEPDPPN